MLVALLTGFNNFIQRRVNSLVLDVLCNFFHFWSLIRTQIRMEMIFGAKLIRSWIHCQKYDEISQNLLKNKFMYFFLYVRLDYKQWVFISIYSAYIILFFPFPKGDLVNLAFSACRYAFFTYVYIIQIYCKLTCNVN